MRILANGFYGDARAWVSERQSERNVLAKMECVLISFTKIKKKNTFFLQALL